MSRTIVSLSLFVVLASVLFLAIQSAEQRSGGPCHSRTFRPSSELEIEEILREARRSRATVRVIGNRRVALLCDNRTRDNPWLISLERFNKVLGWTHNSLEVEGGISLDAVVSALQTRGLQLPSFINFLETQTSLIGAITNGIKGSSCVLPGLDMSVQSYSLLLANGTILQDLSVLNQPDVFHACLVAMGMCGLIVRLRVQTEVAKLVRVQHRVVSFAAVAAETGMLERDLVPHQYAGAYWFPHTDHFKTWTADVVWSDSNREIVLPQLAWAQSQVLCALGVLSSQFPWLTPRIQLLVAFVDHTLTALSPEVIHPVSQAFRLFSPWESSAKVDYFVDMKAFSISKVLAALSKALATNVELFAVEICFTRSDHHYLSPAYSEHDTVFVSFSFVLQSTTGENFTKGLDAVFRQFHARTLFSKGRHNPSHLRAILARYDDFVSMRKQLDPRGMFFASDLATLFSERPA